MLYDTHIHTKMSADSHIDITEAVRAAKKLSIGVILTEHVDYECDSDINFVADVPDYLEKYAPYKTERLLTGLEIGLTEDCLDRSRLAVSDPRLDFIIGSIHVVEGHDIFTTFFMQELPPEEIYRRYLRYTARMIEKYDCFDSLGHIDYPSRYSPFPESNIAYNAYQQEYDQVFRLLRDKGTALEINTKRFHNPAAKKNMFTLCQAYYECGGRFVTIGSDAHYADQIGRQLAEAYGMARSIGLTPVFYRERQMHNIIS